MPDSASKKLALVKELINKSKLEEALQHIEKIERDLIEIQAAIAQKDIIPDSDEMENQILNYIKRKYKDRFTLN